MSALLSAVNKARQQSVDRDEDYFYYPARDAAGNGSAVLRFLPATSDEDLPFVKIYSHAFKGPTGKWLIDNCPTTLEQECPVCAANSQLYATMSKEDARKYGMNRKTSFISRVLVVEDKKNPENEGKVFLFKYGTKVFEKIADALQPVDEDDTKYNVFNTPDEEGPWPVFKYKIRKVDGQTNYDKSTFEASDEGLDVNFRKQFTPENEIKKFIDPAKFKSKEELQRRLDFVLGNTVRHAPAVAASAKAEKVDEDMPKKVEQPTKQSIRKEVAKPAQDDEDDILSLVTRLAADEDDGLSF